MQISTVTQKGQITLPVNIRKSLGVGPYDKVQIKLEDGVVAVTPVVSLLDISGTIKPKKNRKVNVLNARDAMAREYRRF